MYAIRKMLAVSTMLVLMLAGQIVSPVGNAAAAETPLLKQLGEEIHTIAEKAGPAVVSIISTTVRTQNFIDPFGAFGSPFFSRPRVEQKKYLQQGLGCGFIISDDGYILTNNHVVAGTTELKVVLSDDREFAAKVIGTDPETEVAVVKIDAKDLPTLELGNSDSLKVGNIVLAIGSPQGLEQTVTMGIVSAVNRAQVVTASNFADFVQTDAAINPGNSGGPLLDADGKVVGINTAIYSTSGGSQGMGFAISINPAREVADSLRKNGKIERGYMGILMTTLNKDMAEHLETGEETGIVVSEVVDDSPAKGVLEVDDAIVSIDGKDVKDNEDVLKHVANLPPGKEIKLDIYRDGKKMTVNLTLGTRPDLSATTRDPRVPQPENQAQSEDIENLGITVKEARPEELEILGYEGIEGLLVTKVDALSDAYKKGLRTNMLIVEVNRSKVANLEDLKNALREGRSKSTVMIRVHTSRGDELFFIHRK